jgi:leucyl-tRNA synthetase
MELLNAVAKFPQTAPQDHSVAQEALEIAVMALSPIIPHVTHALWKELGHRTGLIDELWREADAEALQSATAQMVVQVNGKLRAHITVAVGADEAAVRGAALADANVQKFIGTSVVRKVIIVPGKLVNIVV